MIFVEWILKWISDFWNLWTEGTEEIAGLWFASGFITQVDTIGLMILVPHVDDYLPKCGVDVAWMSCIIWKKTSSLPSDPYLIFIPIWFWCF